MVKNDVGRGTKLTIPGVRVIIEHHYSGIKIFLSLNAIQTIKQERFFHSLAPTATYHRRQRHTIVDSDIPSRRLTDTRRYRRHDVDIVDDKIGSPRLIDNSYAGEMFIQKSY
ncbi:hypothetical protein EVAR_96736_1 [Eumeta japonica]|uniref:Uncharacterized protein n=1 Tax=Eumeta variegata TaxID=151549 RepID=A0A4C1Y325_EUMVA|nr:hypothetical protein EVAR_96736_1 [Eumeta japonica]